MFIVFPRVRMRISVFALPLLVLMLWCEGIIPFSVLILSAAFHEAGHIMEMYFLGYPIRRIDVLPMGALIVCPEGIPYKDEYKIALAGPLVSLAISILAFVVFLFIGEVIWLFCCLTNLVLGVFNLMPIKKLDGGKALCYYLLAKEKTAEPLCAAVSLIFKCLFLVALGFCIGLSELNLGVLLLSISLAFQLLGEK